jgi:DUF4097 and DUF4098 domain-containing protein YvlB
MKTIVIVILAALMNTVVFAQSFQETITKELTFEKQSSDNAVLIANMNGNVKVTGYQGDKVIVEVKKSVFGKTEARLEKGKKVLQLGVIDRADTLIFFIEDGCNSFGRLDKRRHQGNHFKGWGYNWNCNDGDCERHHEFDYKMDFTVRVPAGVNVIVSTINDGDISVENVAGAIKANNINGSIRLSNLMREADASTINGDVDVEYTMNPKSECRFYSLNGDINALFQKGLAANLSFESFNGDFYTNVNEIQSLPVMVEKSAKGEGIRYKINGNRYQIGNGGVFLDFETFNGNVYLKEK